MKLVVGLGNPGRKYRGTRHNVGFATLDLLAAKYATSKPKANFQGEVVEADLNGAKALLLWPHTFMNRSGGSVLAARDFYKLELEELLIVCDDLNLPLAKLRFRSEGSAGGQNGLADIIIRLNTPKIPRLRIGIGATPGERDAKDWVLSGFRKEEKADIEIALNRAADAAVDWAKSGIDFCMNRYN